MDRFAASSSTAGQPPRQLSSIDDVQRWLTTLTEATSTQQLESVRAAVNVLKTPEAKRDDVRPLCKIWPVRQDRGKQRPLEQVIRELKEHVIKVSNELRFNLEQHAQSATDIATQPAEPPQQKKRNFAPDSAPTQPTAKAKPTTRQQKRKQDSPALVAEASDTSNAAQAAFPQSKTQRLTQFGFECRSGPAIAPEADVVEQDAATDTPKDAKNLALRRHEMTRLYSELKFYRDANPNIPGIEDLIKQCGNLQRRLPCVQRTLESRPVRDLYEPTCGGLVQRADDDWTTLERQDYTTISLCAYDGLLNRIAKRSETWETVDATEFPILSDIQSFFHSAELNALPAASSTETARGTYWMPSSRHQFLSDLRQLVAAPTIPFGSPSRAIKFLGGDVFHSLKMLAQLEMPDACFDHLPSLRRAQNLYQMVSESRLATCNQSFTTSDVQQVLRDFAASSHIANKWILQVLRISNVGHLDSTLGINAPLGRDLWTDHPPTKTHPWQVLFAKEQSLNRKLSPA